MMNQDINHPETYIAAPDDPAMVARDAIAPPSRPKVVIPVPTDDHPGIRPDGKTARQDRGNLYGMPLAWRGLHLLGVAIGIAAVWFVVAWIWHGTIPLGLYPSRIRLSSGNPSDPILPPQWLLAFVGLLALIATGMMFLGTQDVNPKLMFRKAKETDHAPDDIR